MWRLIVSVLASIFSFLRKRNEDNNAPEMKERDKLQKDINEQNKIEDAVAKQDTAAVRNAVGD